MWMTSCLLTIHLQHVPRASPALLPLRGPPSIHGLKRRGC